MTTLTTAPLAPLLDRMFAEAEAPASPQVRAALAQLTPEERRRLSASTDEADYRKFYGLAREDYLAVSRDTARLLYMLVRAAGARSIVEFGTSFGISTLHLAAGLRDNGGGRIITTEFEPSKAARARRTSPQADWPISSSCGRGTRCRPSPATCPAGSTSCCSTAPRASTHPSWRSSKNT